MPLFHSSSITLGLLSSLSAGGSVVCPSGFDAARFFEWVEAFRPTWYMGVSTLHQALLAEAPSHRDAIARSPFRFIRAGAGALSPVVQAELESTFNAPVIAAYGMTEAGLISCNPLPPRERKPGSVGLPAGQDVAIMNPEGNLLSAGETGEIVVRGPSVLTAYENHPEASREAFTNGWFRTGDEGVFDADGYLFITGRLKEMINRGGVKVSPQEVDDVLRAHPGVVQAATFAIPHVRYGEEVASAVVLNESAMVTASELRRFVATRLAAFKIPNQVLIVDAIPLGPTGKPQRHRLAEQLGLAHSKPVPAEPVTPWEEVAALWATVLGIDNPGRDENFFQLGGDSLLATQLLSRIREVAQVELSFREFFELPTVADIANHIATVHQDQSSQRSPIARTALPDTPLPLSFGQQRLWFLAQLGLSRHAYNLLEVIRISGPLKVVVLQQSLQDIVQRHAILRTTFTHVDGEPRQKISPDMKVEMPIIKLNQPSPYAWDKQIHDLAQREVRKPFDLVRGPLIRVTLVQLADEDYVFFLTLQHMVSDGWSHGLLWRELTAFYRARSTGQSMPLSDLPIQYADFATWQRQRLQTHELDIHLAYWKGRLKGAPTLQLPSDHPRPAVEGFRGGRYALTLSPALTSGLKRLSQQHGVTLYMTLLSAFQTLLYRYSGQDDIVVGSLIANRNRVELEGLIGFFVNTLALRTDLSGDPSFQDLLIRVREVTLGAYEHQDMPYEKLLEALRPPRDLSRNPLFQVLCTLHNTPPHKPELPGLFVTSLDLDPGTSLFDIMLQFWETSEGLLSRFTYSTELFEAATIVRMAGHLQILLEAVVVEPYQRLSRLPLLTPDERHRVLIEWNKDTATESQHLCVHRLFEAQVDRTPEAMALIAGDVFVTYQELNRRANQVAHYLLALGVEANSTVGICLERSADLAASLLGVLKVGAAYVPLDPVYPPERLGYMLADAKVKLVLTQQDLAEP